MKIPKITLKFVIIAIVFILLLGIAPMTLLALQSDINNELTTTSITNTYVHYPTSQSSHLGYVNTGNQYKDTYSLSNTLQLNSNLVYDSSCWAFITGGGVVSVYQKIFYEDSTMQETPEQILTLSNSATCQRFTNPYPFKPVDYIEIWSKGDTTDRHAVNSEVISASTNSLNNILITTNLISEPINSLSLTYDILGGTTSSEYSVDGSEWISITNSDTLIDIDETSQLFFKFVLSGDNPILSDITYTTDLIVEEAETPETSSSPAQGKILLNNAVSSSELSTKTSFVHTIRTYVQELITKIIGDNTL
jgi:hypothetical protein